MNTSYEFENRKNLHTELRMKMIHRARYQPDDEEDKCLCISCGKVFGDQQMSHDIFNPHLGVYACLDCIHDNPLCCCDDSPQCVLQAITCFHFKRKCVKVLDDELKWRGKVCYRMELTSEGFEALLPAVIKGKEMGIEYDWTDEDELLNIYKTGCSSWQGNQIRSL